MTKKLNLREKKFCKEYVKSNGNQTDAVLKAGYNVLGRGGQKKNERAIASEMGKIILRRPKVQKGIDELLEDNGITKGEIAKTMKKLLKSKDERVQLTVLDQLHKILGIYSPEKKMLLAKSQIYDDIAVFPEEEDAEEAKIEPQKKSFPTIQMEEEEE
jgi:phage terminase small subunit